MAYTGEPYDFTYVLIPQDDALPFKEFTGVAALIGDTLTELLKRDFAGGPLTNMDALKAEYGDVIDQKMGDFQAAADRGSVEVLALVNPSKTTLPQPNTGTFLYYDEMGSLKGRLPNRRAFELARQCGKDLETPLPGDVFIGRVTTEQGPRSVSFALSEMASTSPWILQAPSENTEMQNAMRGLKDVMKEKQVGAKSKEEEEAEEIAKGWRWTQSEDEVEVTVTVPQGTQTRGLDVVINRLSVRVALKADASKPLVDLKLFAPVCADDSTWTLGNDERGPHVQLTLSKEEILTWSRIEKKA